MSFLRTYRGEFSNTLPGADNAAAEQVVRIDINQGGTAGPEVSLTARAATFGSSFTISPFGGNSTYAKLAAFFVAGKTFDLTATAGGDGRYTILPTVGYSPPNPLLSLVGTITFSVSTPIPGGSLLTDAAVFTDVTVNTVIPLDMAGDPLRISIVDNDEDKFTPIKGKQATIQILTNEIIDINTFCEADDEAFYVEIFVDELIIFRGFLMIPNMSQEFMPNPNVLTLMATDNLGTLRDIELVNDDNDAPQNDHQIIKYIAWALRKTGVLQNINIINSVRHGAGATEVLGTFTYSGDNHVITVSNANAQKFYVGQTITISGTASNNGTVQVLSISNADPFIVKITTDGTFTTESILFTIEDVTSTMPFYEACYLDAKTFEKEIGSLEDCYSVLTKILTEDCFLFQCLGEWYIVRIDDMQGDGEYSVDRFDSGGEYIDTISIDRNKGLGKPSIIEWMNDDAVIIPDRAYKEVKLTYKYETPAEIICNIDFSQGDFTGDLADVRENSAGDPVTDSGDFAATDEVYNAKSFDLEGWTLGRYARLDPTPGAATTTAYIKRLYQFGYEKQRYAAVGFSSAATPYEYIRSCPIRINKKDKFTFSVDFKFSANGGGDDVPVAGYLLYGDDGNVYEWVDAGVWNNMTTFIAGSPVFDTLVISSSQFNYDGGLKTQWNTFASDMLPAPVGGILYIYLQANYTITGGFIFYENISFNYAPYINGSYQKYFGQLHSVSQASNNKALRDKQVYISDSPSMQFKGALKVPGISQYSPTQEEFTLAKGFRDANHSTPVPFGELQAFAVWNQYRKSNRNFDGDLDLMESDVVDDGNYDGADLIHKYRLTDVNVNTVNRLFVVLHYEMDFNLLEWKGYVASLYRTDEGKKYDDDHIFKFLSA